MRGLNARCQGHWVGANAGIPLFLFKTASQPTGWQELGHLVRYHTATIVYHLMSVDVFRL